MRSIRTKKVPGAPRPQSGLDNRAKLLPSRAGPSAGSTARAVAGRMANTTACIVMVFTRKRLRQSGTCFESFSGNVRSVPRATDGRMMREVTELKAAKSIADLMLLIVTAWYEKSITPQKKAIIIRAGQRYGLIDDDGRRTPKYFALVNDDVEKLARELTGTRQAKGLCLCGCGKAPRTGRKYATMECLKRFNRMPRWARATGKVAMNQ
jgi:hypothetical protein